MKRLPLFLRLGLAITGQGRYSKPEFEKKPGGPQFNPQNLSGTVDPRSDSTSQSAEIWTSIGDKKPIYYKPIKIRVGNKVIDKLWARVSDGEKDYYVNNDDNRVIIDITHWSDLTVTPENVALVIKLRYLINLIEENYIPLNQVVEMNRERSEAHNHGLSIAIDVIEKEIQRMAQKTDEPITQSAEKNSYS
jgi:hypothetical protein